VRRLMTWHVRLVSRPRLAYVREDFPEGMVYRLWLCWLFVKVRIPSPVEIGKGWPPLVRPLPDAPPPPPPMQNTGREIRDGGPSRMH
jgi:hypothetical protein